MAMARMLAFEKSMEEKGRTHCSACHRRLRPMAKDFQTVWQGHGRDCERRAEPPDADAILRLDGTPEHQRVYRDRVEANA